MTTPENMDNELQQTQSQAVDALMNNLQMQIDLNRAYEIEQAMAIAEQNAPIAKFVKENKLLDQPRYKRQKDQIQSLYKQLDLTITNARNEVAKKLQEIKKSKQTLGAYAQNTK